MRCTSQADRLACGAEAGAFARRNGLGMRASGELVLCVTELLSNAVRHGGGEGRLELRVIEDGIEVEVRDEGPGIASIEDAMRDGWSQGRQREPGEAKPMGAGLGIGLGAVRRLADGMVVESEVGVGTRVRIVKRW
ncbi:ATP-binding protein [Sandaracinus amylolyticus]|uniref:Anti-sigma B factor RsbT n=1 Tax=Sandaracinus amylolyticus TaxID=927083 RepID=A0A0F6VYJ1_9BACT|nr:ATP-binding protein [Sandaracinus amylolyticus]AKF02873.1 Anti-sigma B factor RsbT [Sandaracinus amylolyticus]